MKQENLIIRGNLAFYDSVAAGEPLTSPAQSVAWVNSLADKGVDTLFVLTNNDKYYRQPLNAKIGIINKKDFVEQFGEYADTDFGGAVEILPDEQAAEVLPETEVEAVAEVADEMAETVAETENVEVAAEVEQDTAVEVEAVAEQAVAEPQVIVEKEIVEVEVEKIVVQMPDNDTLKQLIKEAIKELIL